MTTQQIEWAKQHDWYIRAFRGVCENDGMVLVRDTEVDTVLRFTDYQKLRNWAGY